MAEIRPLPGFVRMSDPTPDQDFGSDMASFTGRHPGSDIDAWARRRGAPTPSAAGGPWRRGPADPVEGRLAWEYSEVSCPAAQERRCAVALLNAMGREGWQVVSRHADPSAGADIRYLLMRAAR